MNHIKKRPLYIAVSAILLLMLFSASAFAVTATYTYDALNRLTKVVYDNGNRIDYTYDAAGNISRVTSLSSTDKSTLSVVNGSGSGEYGSGSIVNIAANPPATGKIFDRWTGDVGQVDNVYLANTSITMPDNNVTVYATYKDKPLGMFDLSVSSGTGSGEYEAGQVVSIAASPAPTGKIFDCWTGDTVSIANLNLTNTSLTMPDYNISITATYKNVASTTVYLNVNNGSGGGEYNAGSTVSISADTAPSGQVFDRWIGDISGVANVNLASTTVTLSDSNISITATYKDQTERRVTLTVENGSGSGEYIIGTQVTIKANSAPYGMVFDKWTGYTATVTNINLPETSITMADLNLFIQATYRDKPAGTYSLYVENGTGSGDYQAGEIVMITANTAPIGSVFERWTGQVGNLLFIDDPISFLFMPTADVSLAALYKEVDVTLVDPEGSYYGSRLSHTTVAGGYHACADKGLLMVQSGSYLEDLFFNEVKDTTLSCGWNEFYTAQNSTSTIAGTLTISAGTVVVENLVVGGASPEPDCELCKACRNWQYGMSLIRESCATQAIYRPAFDFEEGSDQGGGYNFGHNVGGVLMMLADCENVDQLSLSEPYAIELVIVEPADGVYFMDVNFSLLNLSNKVTCGNLNGSFSSMVIESFADPTFSGGTPYCVDFSNAATCFQYYPVVAEKELYNPGFWLKDFCNEAILTKNKIKSIRTCFSPFLKAAKPLLLIDMPTFFYDPHLVSSGTTVKVKVSLVARDCELESCVHEMCSCIETIGVFE